VSDSVLAAVLVAPGRYELQEFPYPRLADGALLLQVEMVGICGTDKHTYAGETKQYAGTPAETDTRSRSSRAARTSASSRRSPRLRPSGSSSTAVGSPSATG
jgi:hypothetical protein